MTRVHCRTEMFCSIQNNRGVQFMIRLGGRPFKYILFKVKVSIDIVPLFLITHTLK